MKRKFRNSVAAIMAVILSLSVCMPLAYAYEATPSDPIIIEPYCKIEFRDGNGRDILPGETVELYINYELGDNKNCSFDWYVSGGGTDGDYVTTGFAEGYKGIKITPTKHGTVTVRMLIGNDEGKIIAKDEIEITVIDERNFFVKAAETIAELIKINIAYMSGIGIAITFLGAGVLAAMIELPAYLFNLIFG
ncbi:MAG: hypothetical protein IJD78_07690 [Clostridia bacterium]|nr:hypothetical protein [Clostridia bacterium]